MASLAIYVKMYMLSIDSSCIENTEGSEGLFITSKEFHLIEQMSQFIGNLNLCGSVSVSYAAMFQC